MKKLVIAIIVSCLFVSFSSNAYGAEPTSTNVSNWLISGVVSNTAAIKSGDNVSITIQVKNLSSSPQAFDKFVAAFLPPEMNLESFSSSSNLEYGTWPMNSEAVTANVGSTLLKDRQPIYASPVGTYLGETDLISDKTFVLDPQQTFSFTVNGKANKDWTPGVTVAYILVLNPAASQQELISQAQQGINPFVNSTLSNVNSAFYSYDLAAQNNTAGSASSNKTQPQTKVLAEDAKKDEAPSIFENIKSTNSPTEESKISKAKVNDAKVRSGDNKSGSTNNKDGYVLLTKTQKTLLLASSIIILVIGIFFIAILIRLRRINKQQREYRHALRVMTEKTTHELKEIA
ncbi:MAG: hypothetical protein U0R17_03225 [Acidimicrobiia bacterium]